MSAQVPRRCRRDSRGALCPKRGGGEQQREEKKTPVKKIAGERWADKGEVETFTRKKPLGGRGRDTRNLAMGADLWPGGQSGVRQKTTKRKRER